MSSHSRADLLRYKIAPKYPLSGPFHHSGVGRNPQLEVTFQYRQIYLEPVLAAPAHRCALAPKGQGSLDGDSFCLHRLPVGSVIWLATRLIWAGISGVAYAAPTVGEIEPTGDGPRNLGPALRNKSARIQPGCQNAPGLSLPSCLCSSSDEVVPPHWFPDLPYTGSPSYNLPAVPRASLRLALTPGKKPTNAVCSEHGGTTSANQTRESFQPRPGYKPKSTGYCKVRLHLLTPNSGLILPSTDLFGNRGQPLQPKDSDTAAGHTLLHHRLCWVAQAVSPFINRLRAPDGHTVRLNACSDDSADFSRCVQATAAFGVSQGQGDESGMPLAHDCCLGCTGGPEFGT